VKNGWGVPTATDISLAWVIALAVFPKGHPAIEFLLLLAVADDAIGLGIIAIAYPDPHHPVQPQWMGLALVGMLFAYLLRRCGCMSWGAHTFAAVATCCRRRGALPDPLLRALLQAPTSSWAASPRGWP